MKADAKTEAAVMEVMNRYIEVVSEWIFSSGLQILLILILMWIALKVSKKISNR